MWTPHYKDRVRHGRVFLNVAKAWQDQSGIVARSYHDHSKFVLWTLKLWNIEFSSRLYHDLIAILFFYYIDSSWIVMVLRYCGGGLTKKVRLKKKRWLNNIAMLTGIFLFRTKIIILFSKTDNSMQTGKMYLI